MALINNDTLKKWSISIKWYIITRKLYPKVMNFLKPIALLILRLGKFSKKEIKKINNIYDAVDFMNNFKFLTFSIKASQIKYEITKLLEVLKEKNPKVIIEIGTLRGGTLFLFTKIAHPEAIIISIDLPRGKYGGGYSEWKITLFRSLAKDKQRIELIRADSHDPNTFGIIKNFLKGRMVDFLFIDGDHTYEGVKKDFEMYSSLIKKGGMIAFHDIVNHPNEMGVNVDQLWNEIKKEYKFLEIIEDVNQNWAGIGVLYL